MIKKLIISIFLIVTCIVAAMQAHAFPQRVSVRNNFRTQAHFDRKVHSLNPTLWLRASDLSTVTIDASNRVAQINSRTGSISFTQSTDANKPILSRGDGLENFTLRSEDLTNASYWNVSGYPVSISTNTVTATASSARHGIYQVLTAAAGQTYRFIQEIEYVNHQYVMIGDSGDAVWHVATVDMTDGSITHETNCTATTETISAGRYRITVEFTRTNSGAMAQIVGFSNVSNANSFPTFTPVGTEQFKLYNPAAQRTSMLPTYIPTTTTPIYGSTTGRRGMVFDGSNDILASTSVLSDIKANNTNDEVFAVWAPLSSSADSATPYQNPSLFSDNGGYFIFGAHRSSGTLYFYNYDGSDDATSHSFTFGEPIVGHMRRTYPAGELISSINGGVEQSASTGSTNNLTNVLHLGARAALELNTAFYELIFFNKALTAADRDFIIQSYKRMYEVNS